MERRTRPDGAPAGSGVGFSGRSDWARQAPGPFSAPDPSQRQTGPVPAAPLGALGNAAPPPRASRRAGPAGEPRYGAGATGYGGRGGNGYGSGNGGTGYGGGFGTTGYGGYGETGVAPLLGGDQDTAFPGPPPGPGGRQGAPGEPGDRPTGRKRFIDYPRHDRRGFTRWIPSWKLVGGISGTGVLLLITLFVIAYAMTPIPSIDTSKELPQSSIVFFSNGQQIGTFAKERRTLVELKQVPQHVRDAVLSAEDRSFYSNRGVSPTGIIRAAWNNARGGEMQGGSTITQQYVKNFFLDSDRSLKRKAREFLISIRVARERTKDEILQDYLNKIYFGRGANGIQAASMAYFGKDVSKLSESEGAFLAGIINSPENYDPLDGPKSKQAATERWNYVLDGMVAEGWLDQAKAGAIKQAGLPKVAKPRPSVSRKNQRGYIMDIVAAEAKEKAKLSREQLETGGYVIRTTLDQNLVDQGIEAMSDVLGPRKSWKKGTQAGMASIDPATGAIVAIYAGDDQRFRNAATQDEVIAGSVFKPFTLIAALQGNPAKEDAGPLSLQSRFKGSSPYKLKEDKDGTEIRNFGKGKGEQFGYIDLMDATAHSVNTVYAQLNERVGPDFTRKTAIKAGIPSTASGLENNMTNVLGTSSPHILDIASAYATIANGGTHYPPYSISSVTVAATKGKIYEYTPQAAGTFDSKVMANVSYAMSKVIERGTGSYAQNLGRPAAGKTGTSSGNLSAWFAGFTPQLSTAVAMYRVNDDGKPQKLEGWGRYRGRELTGGTFPVRIWTKYMESALKGKPTEPLPDPSFDGDVVNPEPTQPPAQQPPQEDNQPPGDNGQNPGDGQQPTQPPPTQPPGDGQDPNQPPSDLPPTQQPTQPPPGQEPGAGNPPQGQGNPGRSLTPRGGVPAAGPPRT